MGQPASFFISLLYPPLNLFFCGEWSHFTRPFGHIFLGRADATVIQSGKHLPGRLVYFSLAKYNESILLTFTDASVTLPGLGSVTYNDVVRFVPQTLGANTSGHFELFLYGPNAYLGTKAEAIDAIGFAPDGRLLLSTNGGFKVRSATAALDGKPQDLIVLTTGQPNDYSSATSDIAFDGSDVGMTLGAEDIDGVWVDPSTNGVYLTTRGSVQVPGVTATGSDIILCETNNLGDPTTCNFSLWFDGSDNGVSAVIDGLVLAVPIDELLDQSVALSSQSQHFHRRR